MTLSACPSGDVEALGRTLQDKGVDAFITAWKSLRGRIEPKAAAVAAKR
jgi:hypothetical protein